MSEPTVKISQPSEPAIVSSPSTSDGQTTQQFPSNAITLPSKGLLYPEGHPLRQGFIELKWMTAKEENILTTESYIKQDIVIDKFLQSMIVSPKFDYEDLLIGDKDALVIGSRIYGYGEEYEVTVTAPSQKQQNVKIDLNDIKPREVDYDSFNADNEFVYEFDSRKTGKTKLVFKLLTIRDTKEIEDRLKKYRKAGSADTQITSRLFQMIVSVNGETDRHIVKAFIDNDFLAQDSRKFREYVNKLQPGMNMEIELVDEETSEPFRSKVAIEPHFFWPDSRV